LTDDDDDDDDDDDLPVSSFSNVFPFDTM